MKPILLLVLLTVAGACSTRVVAGEVNPKSTDQSAERTTMTLDQIILEEYKAIRAEIILCLDRRVSIVSLGFTAIGTLLAGGIALLGSKKEHWFVSSIVIGVGVTVTCLYILDVWMVESRRLARASYYNHYLELKIRNLYKSSTLPLEWEQRTKDKDGPYKRILSVDAGKPWIFLVVSVLAALSGLGLFWWGTKDHGNLKRYGMSMLWGAKDDTNLRRYGMRILAFVVCGLLLYYWALPRYKTMKSLDEIWAMTPTYPTSGTP